MCTKTVIYKEKYLKLLHYYYYYSMYNWYACILLIESVVGRLLCWPKHSLTCTLIYIFSMNEYQIIPNSSFS